MRPCLNKATPPCTSTATICPVQPGTVYPYQAPDLHQGLSPPPGLRLRRLFPGFVSPNYTGYCLFPPDPASPNVHRDLSPRNFNCKIDNINFFP